MMLPNGDNDGKAMSLNAYLKDLVSDLMLFSNRFKVWLFG
jgi:hypothetical protein